VTTGQKVLFVINDGPYGSEKAYNALRLAMKLQEEGAAAAVKVFLLADATTCALPAQETPNGYYNVARMLRSIISRGGEVVA